MLEAIIITPVKDSLQTVRLTVKALAETKANIQYYVFNDFSQPATKIFLESKKDTFGFNLIHLEDITSNPSPNYKLVLEIAQKKALEKECPLIIVESDVIVKPDTIPTLLKIAHERKDAGLVGAITVDKLGHYNFPYAYEKEKNDDTIITSHSLSFCCTLITHDFLSKYNFKSLSNSKDWFDVHISKTSRSLGFKNYLVKGAEVLHTPHSSRPWKNLKYKNPVLYYIKKMFSKRDEI
ncbi:MAG: glycosyltransferase [Dysgonamonadaceae bacterium]|nr:glycosyltransferase [Dysgonamonadaceae bacterium]MDD4728475.1 glycosyltransferase [Dysgonamonadaceae bacterium]